MKIRSVILREVANRQTNRQTYKGRAKHDLLGGCKLQHRDRNLLIVC